MYGAIADIGELIPEEVTAKVKFIVSGTKRGCRPKFFRRKEIPKPDGSTRPLGIEQVLLKADTANVDAGSPSFAAHGKYRAQRVIQLD